MQAAIQFFACASKSQSTNKKQTRKRKKKKKETIILQNRNLRKKIVEMRPRMRTPRKPNCQQEKNIPENLKTVNSKKKNERFIYEDNLISLS